MNALTAQEMAQEMARKENESRPRWWKWFHTIRDNPYCRKHPMHTVWHNAFYDECKILNRSIK
tara:strand:- start:482 stop:670 length:189 start_codon:yes stop_codon:yes gene_type:complete